MFAFKAHDLDLDEHAQVRGVVAVVVVVMVG
jgi:hypothetical protein